MSDYRPIPCALHSEYELAIMHRRRVQLRWTGGDEPVLPLDLVARNGEEFLIFERSDGQRQEVRLDHILAFEPEPP